MEALEFLKEAQRMCRSTECHLNCPVHDVCFLQNYDVVSEEDMRIFVSSVVAWSKKHPPKTNAQKFEEVFGEIKIKDLIHIDCNCTSIIDELTIEINETNWWDEPYKEPEHDE